MSFEKQTISIHYAKAVVSAAEQRGYDRLQLLREASINPNLLASEEMRITPEQLARLMQAAWRLEDDEFLGMSPGCCRHGIFTLMAKQAVYCGNLRGVYRHLTRFYNLVTDSISLSFDMEDDQASLSMSLKEPAEDRDHMLVDFLLLLWHRFPAWLAGQRLPLIRVELAFPKPRHAKEYRLLFPCDIEYDCDTNRLIFSAELLSLPVVQTPETLRKHLVRAPLDWFKRQSYYPTYTRRVLDALMPENEFLNLQIDDIAASLGINSRTLRRKLSDENTSFQEIKSLARRDTAIHLLSLRHIPIADIAHRLGFTETASFSRAFKSWTGITPQGFKQ
ncbi:AraC family transcriptional regulator [Marinobacterium sp. YM272]|uniref:AraC family transcriptional regulator n=1 Tax=Marinobacterium sp. YM272 TaxID=3421654 RepID=UPI003D7F9F6E